MWCAPMRISEVSVSPKKGVDLAEVGGVGLDEVGDVGVIAAVGGVRGGAEPAGHQRVGARAPAGQNLATFVMP